MPMCFFTRAKKLTRQVEVLSLQTELLTDRVQSLENQLLTGLTIIPSFIDFFGNRTSQRVRVSTMFVTLEGIVIATADDGVQLREPSGDLVLIPFSKINSVH
ncbi:hypothetical protein SAMN05661091_1976 [Paenibacillus uliginis N3/975]|uniref:YolD-like protein n=1 Tax=Paenibacillus uliginis N3/975 TaxID=1313296 RepID=A0A1X7H806_9BACL|nr:MULTISPECIES: hypothetical protein [Paenibacillus]UNK16742.1 hypothetical protein MNQ98_19860 [Paenibacillus sp. N3/727]SMF81334.1 hypothetical protein SAMN05661091_1976 [Paenibacillus uliginis N3/975]